MLTRNIWLYDRGDYTPLACDIEATDWGALKDDDIDVYANNVTDYIIIQANKHIINKSVKIRQSDPPWLHNNIRKPMRNRTRYIDKYKRTSNLAYFEKYKQLRSHEPREIHKSRKIQKHTRKRLEKQ